MVIFDLDGKKIFQCQIQMELDLLDKKIARVLTARNELHQAVCDLFNGDMASADGNWITDDSPSNIKATPVSENLTNVRYEE